MCAVLLTEEEVNEIERKKNLEMLNIKKYGEWVEHDGKRYLLTNFRAVVNDFEKYGHLGVDLRKRYNTEEECKIIKEHFHVFLYNVDFPTRSQMVRHRVNWQELSRRYVSGERVGFEFYISEKMKNVWSNQIATFEFGGKVEYTSSTQNVIDNCLKHYLKALEDGVKPQEARRIIPQAAYTKIWGAFQPTQLDNFFKLRLDKHAQWEIRQVAEAMKKSVDAGLNDYIPTPEEEERICKRLEEYAEKGSDCLMSKEEVQSLLDQADENDINGAGNCDC
jgi:thymidylate synthase (FAD)